MHSFMGEVTVHTAPHPPSHTLFVIVICLDVVVCFFLVFFWFFFGFFLVFFWFFFGFFSFFFSSSLAGGK